MGNAATAKKGDPENGKCLRFDQAVKDRPFLLFPVQVLYGHYDN